MNAILIAIIGFLGICITSYFNWKISKNAKDQAAKIAEIHILINSRMTELLKSTRAEGNLEGRKESKEENKDKVL